MFGQLVYLEPLRNHKKMRFFARPLHTPHVAAVTADGHTTLFVRFARRLSKDEVAFAANLKEEVVLAINAATREGGKLRQAVVVGTDSLFPGDTTEGILHAAEGFDAAIDALFDVFSALADAAVPVLWRMRGGLHGTLPLALAQRLADAKTTSLELGIPTLDDGLARALEGPKTAPTSSRLRLATALHARGMPVRALIDPLVPMLTDTPASLEELLRSLADAGVHQVGIRYLVLTRGRAKHMAQGLSKMQRALIRGCFSGQPWLAGDPEATSNTRRDAHKLLPVNLRAGGHRRVADVAARLGISVTILDDEPTAAQELTTKHKARRRPKRARPQLELFRAKR